MPNKKNPNTLREQVIAILIGQPLEGIATYIQNLELDGALQGAVRDPSFMSDRFRRGSIRLMTLNKFPIEIDRSTDAHTTTQLISFRKRESFVVVELTMGENCDSASDGTIDWAARR